ncbi:MAG: HAMP domain-containing histidine kinase [Clostridia bacterium]|nr:HAMP domain-containing histidine kinase [Clostridia bacterium]
MIKQLRRRFIAIAMCSIVLVLGIIIGAVNFISFQNIKDSADVRLEIITENDGIFPMFDDKKPLKHFNNKMSPEAPFDTRYFTVTVRPDGTVIEVNTGKIAAVSSEIATQYAVELFQKNNTVGFVDTYRYKAVSVGKNTLYAFVDCERELSTFFTFLLTSLGISIVGIFAVFVLVFFLSKIVTKTAVQSAQKQKMFITDASHEIKTPLTIIDANTEIIEMEHGESEWTRSTRNQIHRLAELTNKLVMLAKLDENENALLMSDFSLSQAVEETASEFEALSKANGKEFEMQIQDNLTLCGEEKSIRQLVSLLCENAVKYSNDGGQIQLTLAKTGKKNTLTVYNTVDEIQKGNLDILFERFYRTDASRSSQSGGHGIGLSVAKAIVSAHKGKITAKSTDGKSLVITVII